MVSIATNISRFIYGSLFIYLAIYMFTSFLSFTLYITITITQRIYGSVNTSYITDIKRIQ